MYACMTPVGFDISDKFENHCSKMSFFSSAARAITLNLLKCFFLFFSVDSFSVSVTLFLCRYLK